MAMVKKYVGRQDSMILNQTTFETFDPPKKYQGGHIEQLISLEFSRNMMKNTCYLQ